MNKLLAIALGLFLSGPAWPISGEPYRGMALLALLNPRFPVAKAYDILDSNPRPAFSFLYKSFGSKYDNLKVLLNRLSSNANYTSRPILAIVYVDCGPCRPPRRPKGLFPLIAHQETQASLNRKLEHGNKKVLRKFRLAFEAVVKRLPVMDGVTYLLNVGLEDNYTDKAYFRLSALANKAAIARMDIIIGRNPQYPNKTTPGPLESHDFTISGLSKLSPGDVISADGSNLLKDKDHCSSGLTEAQTREVIDGAKRRSTIVLLWQPENQGLPRCAGPTRHLLSPHQRRYRFTNIKELKQLLRR